MYLRVTGGQVPELSSLVKLVPLNISPNKTAEEIRKATEAYLGQELTVKLTVHNRFSFFE